MYPGNCQQIFRLGESKAKLVLRIRIYKTNITLTLNPLYLFLFRFNVSVKFTLAHFPGLLSLNANSECFF